MLRMLLALVVVGLVVTTVFRMMGSQLGGAARVTGADLGTSSPAPSTPRAVVDQAGQAAVQALQQGAAAQAARASEAGQ